MYAAGSYLANWAIDRKDYYTGSPFDLPILASFVWFGTAGIVAYQRKPTPDPVPRHEEEISRWPARVAMTAVISIPIMALWSLRYSPNRESVRTFRIGVTQVTLLVVTALHSCANDSSTATALACSKLRTIRSKTSNTFRRR